MSMRIPTRSELNKRDAFYEMVRKDIESAMKQNYVSTVSRENLNHHGRLIYELRKRSIKE